MLVDHCLITSSCREDARKALIDLLDGVSRFLNYDIIALCRLFGT